MNEQESTTNRWRERFHGARWVLITCVLVFGGLYINGRIAGIDAFLAFSLVFLAAIAVPRRTRQQLANEPLAVDRGSNPDASIKGFAETLTEPVLIVDRRAFLRYRNKAASAQFPAATVGDPLSFSLRNPTFLSTIDQAIESKKRVVGQFHEMVPANNWYEISATPLEQVRGNDKSTWRSEYLVVAITNQTEQHKHDQMRADFVANASHELRTPLTSLIGFLDTLRGPAAKDEAAREKFMGIMHVQAERMSRLIDDLLSLSRIELRQHMQPTTSVDVMSIANEVVELLQPQAEAADVKITVSNQLDDSSVKGDRNELVQVLSNLVENAIKYGERGKSVEIEIDNCTERHNHSAQIRVIDHGVGIPPEHVPRLTERFYRVDVESSRRKQGTGLGLAIVKHIINRHRGQLTIASVVDEGTTVTICLP